jgi:hypothetical protein
MKNGLLRFLAFSAVLAALSCASSGDRSATSPPGSRIPFTPWRNKIILPATVGDSRELRIILDTGMSFEGLLLYNSALVDSIELRNPVRAQVGGAGSGPAPTALMADSMAFRIGEVEFPDQRIVILEGGAMNEFYADGVCGYSLFGSYVVELDYDRMEVRLHAPDSFAPGPSWTALPISFKENTIPWIETTASLTGADSLVLSCYIDLASSETLELLIRDGMKFTLPDGLEDVYLGRGLSGDIYGKRGKAAWVGLGPYRVRDLTVAFAPAEVRSKQPGADAVVGNGLLSRFHYALDYGGKRLYLRPVSE